MNPPNELENAYFDGVNEGRDLARDELEPIIKALVSYVRSISDNQSFDYGLQTFTLDDIEGRLTT